MQWSWGKNVFIKNEIIIKNYSDNNLMTSYSSQLLVYLTKMNHVFIT